MARAKTLRDAAGRLDWRCQACQQPIADGAGTLSIDYGDIGRVQEWQRAHYNPELGGHVYTGADLLDGPEAHWKVLHHACDPNPDGAGQYHFDVSTIRTLEQTLNWTAHLLDKDWLPDTDWAELIYALPGVTR
jgi:hypothetical protein